MFTVMIMAKYNKKPIVVEAERRKMSYENYTKKEIKFYLEEKLALDVTELITGLMEKGNIKKATLAGKLQKSKGYIAQLLDGRTDMTLRTVADVLWALDSRLTVSVTPLLSIKDEE